MSEGRRTSAKRARTVSGTNGKIPSYLSKFVGRTQDVASVLELLKDDSSQLVTLTGPDGVGKTRLASRIAADLYDDFKDGLCWIDLGSLSDPQLLLQTVADSLGLADDGAAEPVAALSEYLNGRKLLLVLDNCDQFLGSCAALAADLLQENPHLRILTTSRDSLNIEEETIWPVAGLTFPDELSWGIESNFIFEFTGYDALKLFRDRAMSAKSVFRLTATSVDPVIEICRQLDGLPLAIELAAARVRLMGVTRIAEQIGQRLDYLNSNGHAIPAAEQPLFAALDWSHELLTRKEKVLLRRLSVFQDAFSLEAAEAIISDSEYFPDEEIRFKREELLEPLAGLIDKSFVMVERPKEERNAYRLLDAVRRFAAEQLSEAGEAEAIKDAHLNYYQQFVLAADSGLRGSDQERWIWLLQMEYGNLRQALRWAAHRSRQDRPNGYAGILLDMTTRLVGFWFEGHYSAEGRCWLDRAIETPQKKDDNPVLARALWSSGTLAWKMGDAEAARHRLEESLDLGSSWI